MPIESPSQIVRQWSSKEVCQIARVSPRQLQWWDEREVVSPPHQGHRRIYLAEDVIGISMIARMRMLRLS